MGRDPLSRVENRDPWVAPTCVERIATRGSLLHALRESRPVGRSYMR